LNSNCAGPPGQHRDIALNARRPLLRIVPVPVEIGAAGAVN
jgi:hypothetical protein